MQLPKLFAALLAMGVFTQVACRPELIFSESKELPGYWTYADSVLFEYVIEDTSRSYNLTLEVDHTDVFASENLYVKFVTVYPNGLRQSEAVSLQLADNFGRWLGDCSGPNCSLSIPLQDSARFPERGPYQLGIQQYMREDSIRGIEGVKLSLSIAE